MKGDLQTATEAVWHVQADSAVRYVTGSDTRLRKLVWAVSAALAVPLQTTWLEWVRVGGVLPNLALLLVVYFALSDGEERAMFTGLLTGIIEDVLTDAVLGHHVLCNVVVGYAVGRFSTRLISEHPAIKTGLVFCSAVAHGVLFTTILYVQQPSLAALDHIVARVVPAAFYTALATPVVFVLLDRLFRRETPLADGVGPS